MFSENINLKSPKWKRTFTYLQITWASPGCVRGLQKLVLTGQCKWIERHYWNVNYIVLLLHVIDNKLISKILTQFRRHSPMISLSDYFFPPLSWSKLPSPCTTPKSLYFFYSNCSHVYLPYKTLSSLRKSSLEEKDLVWHSISIMSSEWVSIWAKEELVDKILKGISVCRNDMHMLSFNF